MKRQTQFISATVGITAMLLLLGASSAMAEEAGCGASTTVQKGDTLSSIADRCSVSEAALLDANPTIQGSADLQVGEQLTVDHGSGTEQKVGAALSTFSRKASNAIGALAGDVGSSVADLLDKNPDLKARVDKLGSQAGLTGGREAPTAAVSPQTGRSGSTVTITASGLPANSALAIGAGAPGTAYDVIAHAQSTANGTMTTTVQVPQDTTQGQVLVFSVATGPGSSIRTGRFVISP